MDDNRLRRTDAVAAIGLASSTFSDRVRNPGDWPSFPRPDENESWDENELVAYRNSRRAKGGLAYSMGDIVIIVPLTFAWLRESMIKSEIEPLEAQMLPGQSRWSEASLRDLRVFTRNATIANAAFIEFRKHEVIRYLGDVGCMTDTEATHTFTIIDFFDKLRGTVSMRLVRLAELPAKEKAETPGDRFRKAAFEFVGGGAPLMTHEGAAVNNLCEQIDKIRTELGPRLG